MPIKRLDIKQILSDPDARRKLMVSTIQATQARENIKTSTDQAERAYYVVTEAERATFFDLDSFRVNSAEIDPRHTHFVKTLRGDSFDSVYEVGFRDFQSIEGAPLAFSRIAAVGNVFAENPKLEPSQAVARQGKATGDDSRWLKHHWEVIRKDWVPFAKGGEFSRFYSDIYLRLDWDPDKREELKAGGNALPNLDYYFKPGLTWGRRNVKGLSVRVLPEGCVFADKGPAMFVRNEKNFFYLLAVSNTHLFEYLFKTKTSFSWEVGIMKSMPIPHPTPDQRDRIGGYAELIHNAKAAWDEGNEISTRFSKPWLLQECWTGGASTLTEALDAVLDAEEAEDARIQQTYAKLNTAVYKLYGITDKNRARIEDALGQRPPELIWPQMGGKTREQKRLEHVYRLLSYALQQVLAADEDGIIPFQAVAGETPLIDRLLRQLASYFPNEDSSRLEITIVNELKTKVKGAKKAETIADWLNNQFFAWHASLYQSRPIRWHLASNQDRRREPAFAALIDYHKFDRNRMAKLRSTYVKEFLATLRKNAAMASKEGREADRLELEDQVEEVTRFDQQLARIEEGHHEGSEGGDRDYRILTPWKSPAERPQGWDPDIDDGVKVNITPLIRANILRNNGNLGMKETEED